MRTTLRKRLMGLPILLSFLFLNAANAQSPVILFQKTIGGSSFEAFSEVQRTADGGSISVGYTVSQASGDKTENNFSNSLDTSDIWVVKLDAQGVVQWENTISANNHDMAESIKQTSDGGYIIGANSMSSISGDKTENSYGGQDYWLIKLDANGVIQWQKTMGGAGTDNLNDVQLTSDGGFIAGGYSDSGISGNKTVASLGSHDNWVIKFDANGNIEWQNVFGTNGIDILNEMKQTVDGGYILGGFTYEYVGVTPNFTRYGAHDFYVVKIDALGNFQWHKAYGGTDDDYIESLQQTTDGGYILGGYSRSNVSGIKTENSNGGTNGDYWLVKIDAVGNIQWQNDIGGSSLEWMKSVQQTLDGGYILGGYSYSGVSGDKTEANKGGGDYWVVKTNNVGSIQWQKTIGGYGDDMLFSIQQLADGSYLMGGYSEANISGDKTENSKGETDYWVVNLSDSGAVNAPSVSDVYYCPNASAQPLSAIGQDLLWYTTPTGGVGSTTAPTPTTTTVGYTTFYVSQTLNNVESPRVAISSVVKAPPSVTISGLGTMCAGTSQLISAYAGISFVWNDGVTTGQRTIAPTTTTTYTVTITGHNGCTNTGSRTFIVNAPPVASIVSVNSVCNGTSTTLTASSGSNSGTYGFRWSTGQWNSGVSGTITVAPTSTRTYSVTVTGGNGTSCTSVASKMITVTGVAPSSMSIVGLASSYPKTAAAVNLVGSSTGGTFRVDNVVRTNFNPAILSVGNHTVTYTITQGLCNSVITRTVNVTNPTTTNLQSAAQLAFNGVLENKKVRLEWFNNTGYKNDYFVIQKLNSDGQFVDFQTIDSEKIENDSELHFYSVYDALPTEGDNAYRVKTVFNDGNSMTSDLKMVNFKSKGQVAVFPNPATDYIEVNLENYVGKPVQMNLFNQFGQVMQSRNIEKVSNSIEKIDLPSAFSGIYHLHISSKGVRDNVIKVVVNQ